MNPFVDPAAWEDAGPERKAVKPPISIASDSEWDRSLPDPWLSTAFASRRGVVLYVRQDVPEETQARLRRAAAAEGVRLYFTARDDATNLLLAAGPVLNPNGCEVSLLIYWTPKDVEFAVGWLDFKTAIQDEKVRQRNNLSGRFKAGEQTLRIKDVSGWAGKAGLDSFAESMGVENPYKKLVGKEDKGRMHAVLIERPEDFLKYAVGDVRVLIDLQRAFLEQFSGLQTEVLGMSEDEVWTAEDIPMTTGALVARTLEKWLYSRAQNRRLLTFCIRKLGVLDPDAKDHSAYVEARNRVVNQYKTTDALADALERMAEVGDRDLDRFVHKARFLQTALDAAGVKWWAHRPETETTGYLALIHGGRCVNEQPYQYTVDHGVDIDISGCYGEALRSLVYPFGLPRVWAWTPNEERPTLGEWLDQHEKDLLPGLWTAVVSGPLGFAQDLIHSRLVKPADIRRAADKWDALDGDGELPGDFVLLRREIHNGVITADLLDALRRVATNAEWAGLRRLKMVTAAAYLKRDRLDTVEDWCECILRDGGSYSTDSCTGTVRDTRTRAWVGIPLEEFVGRLADRRKHYKAMAKDPNVAADERARAAGLEQVLKLTVNTIYGILVSRFFTVGNTVVGNNITAKARLGVWMLAKALGLRQTITDGGIYTPVAVPWFTADRRPGLNVLSRIWDWTSSRRGRKLVPLAGLDWIALADQLPAAADLDRMASDHVKEFWAPYGLSFPFAIAHKSENTFRRAAYWSKGDYGLLTANGMKYAVRGKDKRARSRMLPHPSFELLDNIVNGLDQFPEDLNYTHKSILGLAKWRLVQESKGYEDWKNLRPGDDHFETRTARYNNTHFPLDRAEDYLRRRNRRKVNRGQEVAWFERFGARGIAEVHRRMAADKLR